MRLPAIWTSLNVGSSFHLHAGAQALRAYADYLDANLTMVWAAGLPQRPTHPLPADQVCRDLDPDCAMLGPDEVCAAPDGATSSTTGQPLGPAACPVTCGACAPGGAGWVLRASRLGDVPRAAVRSCCDDSAGCTAQTSREWQGAGVRAARAAAYWGSSVRWGHSFRVAQRRWRGGWSR